VRSDSGGLACSEASIDPLPRPQKACQTTCVRFHLEEEVLEAGGVDAHVALLLAVCALGSLRPCLDLILFIVEQLLLSVFDCGHGFWLAVVLWRVFVRSKAREERASGDDLMCKREKNVMRSCLVLWRSCAELQRRLQEGGEKVAAAATRFCSPRHDHEHRNRSAV